MIKDQLLALSTYFRNIAQNWLFPATCRLCCATTGNGCSVCRPCYEELPWISPGCTTCGIPLPEDGTLPLCESCQRQPPVLDRCQALFDYHAPVDQWICGLKFHGDLTLAKLLGQLLAERVPDGNNTLLVPVPLHPRRLRERGFNQALEIARPLRRRGYIIDPHCCSRTLHTPPQSSLPAKARRHNLRDAFRVHHQVTGKNIVLIDDVFTTGSTLNTLAACLREAGAAHIEAWVIARTPEPGRRRAEDVTGSGQYIKGRQ